MIKKLDNKNILISEKIRSVFQLSYTIEAELLKAVDFPPLKRSLQSFITSENDFFGYIINDEFAGAIEIDNQVEYLHIQSLVVNPKFFRRGIAKQLVQFAFKSYDSLLFSVETGLDNKPAIQLYRNFGFKEVKQWDTDHGVRKIRFEKRIKK